jgi:hypothetical protein
MFVPGDGEGAGAVFGEKRDKPRFAQLEPKHLKGVGFVINEQDFRFH